MTDNENPYRPSGVPVVDFAAPTGEIEYEVPGHKVPAGNGSGWISAGWEMFKDAPLMWICAMLLYCAVSMVTNLVPGLGTIIGMLIAPSLSVGILAFGRGHAREGVTDLGRMFAGFQGEKVGSLVIMALLYAAAMVVSIIVLMLALVIALGGVGAVSQLSSGHGMSTLEHAGGLVALVSILGFVMAMFLIVSAYWFAPGLIYYANLSPVDAMKASCSACLTNWLPLTMYSLVALLIFIAGIIPFGLGLLVVIPVLMASMYPMFEDLFGVE